MQLELARDYTSNVELYPVLHEYFRRIAGAAVGGVGCQ